MRSLPGVLALGSFHKSPYSSFLDEAGSKDDVVVHLALCFFMKGIDLLLSVFMLCRDLYPHKELSSLPVTVLTQEKKSFFQ